MNIITEIVTMKTLEGIDKNIFIDIVDKLEKNFHSKQPGFINSELLYNDKTGEWIMIQHWSSMDQLTSASRKIFHDKLAESFVQSLDPKSVKMLMIPQINTW